MYTLGLGIGPFLRGSETQAAIPAGGSSQTMGGRGGRAFQAEGGPRRERARCSQGSETSVISKAEMVRDLVDA